jgi:hypothetical protein
MTRVIVESDAVVEDAIDSLADERPAMSAARHDDRVVVTVIERVPQPTRPSRCAPTARTLPRPISIAPS